MEYEEWKELSSIEGLEDFQGYFISNLGNVRGKKGKNLKQIINCKYYQVTLLANGKRKSFRIHRLVALAFIPNPNNYPCVNHKDEDRQNNNVNNLEWCTHEYNCNYGTHNEKLSKKMRNNSFRSKQVFCPELMRIFPSMREIERQLGINHGNISECCNKKSQQTAKGMHFYFIELIKL